MIKTVLVDGKIIEYRLKVSLLARSLRLTVSCRHGVMVTVPKRIREEVAEQFVIKKSTWIFRTVEFFKGHPRIINVKHGKEEIVEYKKKAHLLVVDRLHHFNQFYSFVWNRVSIKNTTSRWGSCSKKGNLNFNYKIALLPPELADYIIVHELCHLGELNHSSSFWNLVARTIPDYQEKRKALKSR